MAEGRVRLLNLFHAEEGHEDDVERIVSDLLARAESEGLVVGAELLRDQGDPAHFVMQIEFSSERALEEYLVTAWRKRAVEDLAPMLQRDFRRYVLERVTAGAKQ
jgi:quinol monooxygenase YgiN